ncbi:hypothetical protein ACM66B_002318 [Microbotryomycetes sp. NB124-2]
MTSAPGHDSTSSTLSIRYGEDSVAMETVSASAAAMRRARKAQQKATAKAQQQQAPSLFEGGPREHTNDSVAQDSHQDGLGGLDSPSRRIAKLPSRKSAQASSSVEAHRDTATTAMAPRATSVDELRDRLRRASINRSGPSHPQGGEQPAVAYRIRQRPQPAVSTPLTNTRPVFNHNEVVQQRTNALHVERGFKTSAKQRNQPELPPTQKRIQLLHEVQQSLKGKEKSFDLEVSTLYQFQRASPKALYARAKLIRDLQQILNRHRFKWGHSHSPTASPLVVESFGSARFGLSTSTSDLDLCLFDPYRPQGFDTKYFSTKDSRTTKLPEIYDMRTLASILKQAGFDKVVAISHAAVPIVKFECEIDGVKIQADLNTNERLGVYNSRLIAAYCDLHELIRPFCVFIKFWAAQRGLNDPSGQNGPISFSSYTLLLLVIAYLQSIGVVPNLQDVRLIELKGVEQQLFWSRPKPYIKHGQVWSVTRSIGWDVTFVEKLSTFEYEGQQPPDLTLESMAKGFFKYYAQFDWSKFAVSLKEGKPLERQRPYEDEVSKLRRERKRQMEEIEAAWNAEEARQRAEEEADRDDDDDEDAGDKIVYEPPEQLQSRNELELDLDDDGEEFDDLFEAQARVDYDSRSSTPVAYGDFEEPERWESRSIVTQDPFDLTRNTCGNVEPDVAEKFVVELERACRLLDEGAGLDLLCQPLEHESGGETLAEHRARWRKLQVSAFVEACEELGFDGAEITRRGFGLPVPSRAAAGAGEGKKARRNRNQRSRSKRGGGDKGADAGLAAPLAETG